MNALNYVMSHLKAAQIARDERGVTALEYALIAGLIAVVIIVGVTALGTRINVVFGNIVTSLPSTTGK